MKRTFTVTGVNSYRNDDKTRNYVFTFEGERGESFSISTTKIEEQHEFTFDDTVSITITKEESTHEENPHQ